VVSASANVVAAEHGPAATGWSSTISRRRRTTSSRELQTDLKQLLNWADTHAIELVGRSAAPSRLDDLFRAIDTAA
jgi:ABC-2 type transport system ATP-binding protein